MLDIKYAYLIYSFLFLILAIAIWFIRKDLRKKIILISLIICPLGPISEVWYLKDYWNPPTVFNSLINIEDLIFTFALGGITFGIYKLIFNFQIPQERKYKRRIWFIFFSLLINIFSLVVLSNLLGINSIFSSIIAFSIIILIIWYLRKDLIFPSISSGFFILTIFFIIYKIMFMIFPDLGYYWCNDCNPTGIVVHGMNIEELVWDFLWGMLGGVLYEFISGRVINHSCKINDDDKNEILFKFRNYDGYLNKSIITDKNSVFSKIMFSSTQKVLIIRLTRHLSYLLSRLVGYPLPSWYGLFFIVIFPLYIDIPFAYFDFDTTGMALFWVAFYTLLTFFLLKFSQDAWLSLMRLTGNIDKILPLGFDKNSITRQLSKHLNFSVQLFASFLCGVVGATSLYYLSPFFYQFIHLGFSSYFQVFLNAFLGMNAIYWFWLGPLYIYRLKTIDNLSLCWYSPTDTPAINGLSKLLSKCAIQSIFGLILTLFPLFYYINKIANHQIIYISTILFSLSISAVISISIFPQYLLVKIVKNHKEKLLHNLRIEIENSLTIGTQSAVERKIDLYHNIKRSPYSVIDIKSIISYIVSIILALFPYILKYLITISNYAIR